MSLLLLLACAATPTPAPADLLDALAFPREAERQRSSAPYQLLAPGASLDLLDVQGAGRIVSMWVTFAVVGGDASRALREPSLRMWWDGAADPAVQVPLGDFFALGHGEPGEVVSLPVVSSLTGMSCRWTMPFADGARVRVTNDGPHELRVYWQVDWERVPVEAVGPYRFQAAWRREPMTERGRDFLVADLRGEGNYVGTVLAVDPREPEWWGEGDDLVWIDGAVAPTLLGTGTEDFVHQAWGLRPMSAPFSGVVDQKGRHTTIYRWHVSDPIPFRSSFRMAMQQHAKGSVPRSDDVSATAFWYQRPPLSPVAPLPPADARLPAPGVPKDAWTVRGEVVPVDLAGLADASRFGDGRCGPRSPHPLFDAGGPQTVAGVPFTLLSGCDGDASAVLLAPGERARLPLPAGGDTLYLYVAANGARGADALTVTGEGWARTLRFGEDLDPFDDPWPVARGKLVVSSERGMGIQGGYVVAVPIPAGATWAEVTPAPKVTATIYAAGRGARPEGWEE